MPDYLCPYCHRPTASLVIDDSTDLDHPGYAHPIMWLTRWLDAGKAVCSHLSKTRFSRTKQDGRLARQQERYGVVLDRICEGCPEWYPKVGAVDVAMPHSICEVRRG